MPTLRTVSLPLAIAAVGVVALSGCSSSSSTGTKSAASSTAAASTSASTAASSSAAAPAASSSAPAASASGSAQVGSVIKPLAAKLGCPSAQAKAPTAGAGSTIGATAGITCLVGSTEYLLVQLKPGASPANAAKAIRNSSGTSGKLYYGSGQQWFALGGPQNTKTLPSQKDAQAVQGKIGGSVQSV